MTGRRRRDWPVVVGGCHRSGTSLVRRLLDSHHRIHCGPEVPFFRDFSGDYPGDPLRHLRFSQAARSLLPEADLLSVLGGAFLEVHRRAARHAGKRRWADKAPENVLYAEGWRQLLGSRWLMVHVVRNPLDTIASMREARFPLTLPPELSDQIEHYRRHVEAGLEFEELNPGHCRLVVYDQLCSEPQATVEGLMRWLGEDFELGQLAFNASSRGEGLEDPKIASTSGVHRMGVNSWPSRLEAESAAAVWHATEDLWRRIDPKLRWAHEP